MLATDYRAYKRLTTAFIVYVSPDQGLLLATPAHWEDGDCHHYGLTCISQRSRRKTNSGYGWDTCDSSPLAAARLKAASCGIHGIVRAGLEPAIAIVCRLDIAVRASVLLPVLPQLPLPSNLTTINMSIQHVRTVALLAAELADRLRAQCRGQSYRWQRWLPAVCRAGLRC